MLEQALFDLSEGTSEARRKLCCDLSQGTVPRGVFLPARQRAGITNRELSEIANIFT